MIQSYKITPIISDLELYLSFNYSSKFNSCKCSDIVSAGNKVYLEFEAPDNVNAYKGALLELISITSTLIKIDIEQYFKNRSIAFLNTHKIHETIAYKGSELFDIMRVVLGIYGLVENPDYTTFIQDILDIKFELSNTDLDVYDDYYTDGGFQVTKSKENPMIEFLFRFMKYNQHDCEGVKLLSFIHEMLHGTFEFLVLNSNRKYINPCDIFDSDLFISILYDLVQYSIKVFKKKDIKIISYTRLYDHSHNSFEDNIYKIKSFEYSDYLFGYNYLTRL